MQTPQSTISQGLPELHQLARDLTDLGATLVRDVEYPDDDHYCYMMLAFLSKQVEHLRSMRALSGSPDAGLIARSMLEGLWQLRWAAIDGDARAYQWRCFEWVHAWRAIRADRECGRPVDEIRGQEVEINLRQFGRQFLTQFARKALKTGHGLPRDPYWHNWTGHDIRQLAESARGGEDQTGLGQYFRHYRPYSEWRHWGPGAIGGRENGEGDSMRFEPEEQVDPEDALAVGFLCVADTMSLLVKYLRLGISADITRLIEAFSAWEKRRGLS